MRVKLLVLGATIALLSASCLLLPKAVNSQSVDNVRLSSVESSSDVEMINGMRVSRSEGCFTSPTEIDGLIRESDLIVIGQIQQSLEEAEPLISQDADEGISSFDTSVSMKVMKVFKGGANLENQTIKIGQHIVIRDDNAGKPYIQALEDVYPFQKGRYLLFLKRAVGVDAYFPMGLFYGRYNLDGTDTSEEEINDESYQTIRKLVRQRFKEG